MSDPFRVALAAFHEPGQPDTLYRALDHIIGQLVGHKLFTLLYVTASGEEVARVYSNMPDAYPVGGRKAMGPTPWGDHVMKGLKPYVGHTAEDIRWAFFDHELIASLGCESVLNMPVIYDGRVLGTLNLLHEAGFYRDDHARLLEPYAALLATPFLKLAEQVEKTEF
jgi:GAF domain-containing protein